MTGHRPSTIARGNVKTILVLSVVSSMLTACTFRFGDHESLQFGTRLAAEGSTPELKACGKQLTSLQSDYDKYASRSEWLLWGGALVGAVTVGVAAFSAADTPGDGAPDVDAAVSEEKGVSTVEWFTIGLASAAALSEGLSGVFAVVKGNRLKAIQDVRGVIDRLEAGDTVSQGELITVCKFQPSGTARAMPQNSSMLARHGHSL